VHHPNKAVFVLNDGVDRAGFARTRRLIKGSFLESSAVWTSLRCGLPRIAALVKLPVTATAAK
jgi:hypothetical protein